MNIAWNRWCRNLPSGTPLSLYDNRIIPIIITDITGRCNVRIQNPYTCTTSSARSALASFPGPTQLPMKVERRLIPVMCICRHWFWSYRALKVDKIWEMWKQAPIMSSYLPVNLCFRDRTYTKMKPFPCTLWWSPHCWWHPIQIWSNPALKLTIIVKDINLGKIQSPVSPQLKEDGDGTCTKMMHILCRVYFLPYCWWHPIQIWSYAAPHLTCQLGIHFSWIPGSSALSTQMLSDAEWLGSSVG